MVWALPLVGRARAVDPEYPAALRSSAAGLFMAGDVRAGVDPAVRAARADPTSIYKALGVVRRYAAAGYMAEASEQFAAVEAIWPGHPDLTEHRRRLEVELGRAEAARAYSAASGEEPAPFELLLVLPLVSPSSGSPKVQPP